MHYEPKLKKTQRKKKKLFLLWSVVKFVGFKIFKIIIYIIIINIIIISVVFEHIWKELGL